MNERMSDAEIAAIRERADKATPGNWHLRLMRGVEHDIICMAQNAPIAKGLIKPDAVFIAAAREDVPALCDELEAARSVIAWYADEANWKCFVVDGETRCVAGHDIPERGWVNDNGSHARAHLRGAATEGE